VVFGELPVLISAQVVSVGGQSTSALTGKLPPSAVFKPYTAIGGPPPDALSVFDAQIVICVPAPLELFTLSCVEPPKTNCTPLDVVDPVSPGATHALVTSDQVAGLVVEFAYAVLNVPPTR